MNTNVNMNTDVHVNMHVNVNVNMEIIMNSFNCKLKSQRNEWREMVNPIVSELGRARGRPNYYQNGILLIPDETIWSN